MLRYRIIVDGIVQGVGFRPFIYQLAKRFRLAGFVCNDTRGVIIEVEGNLNSLDSFLAAIRNEKPPLALIQTIRSEDVPTLGTRDFNILQSVFDAARRAQVSPDSHVCEECLEELFAPGNRRFRYPFINCTNCGPRYTIVTGIPYDRPMTTMADFPLCEACQSEYDDPSSRRFHAQPNACPTCGPRLQLHDVNGPLWPEEEPVSAAVALLRQGGILAVKGVGGYHLAVDAGNQHAVAELRRRKQRDEKPFALMARDLTSVRRFALVSDDEERLLSGVERPIVLLEKRPEQVLAANLAPDNLYFGVMLPYTPLHHLLLEQGFDALVMTSANLSDEPIAFEDEEAQERLSTVVDGFLSHNRRIHMRTDDSIARLMQGRPLLLRRSRGFVPRAIALPEESRVVLAVGGEMKNTICLTRGDRAFLSQHVGDLKNLQVYASFQRTIQHLQSILEVQPEVVAHDLHPDYYSSRYALEESGLPTMAVQHHHAHLASCLAEHGVEGAAIGVILDGAGYGADGHIWGGEFLVGDMRSYERFGHFRYQKMPGGDLAAREPWRMALSYLLSTYGEVPAGTTALSGIPDHVIRLAAQATMQGINAPLTSSCGRLFDAVAALLGLRQQISFEGQAAMALEMVADPEQRRAYPYQLSCQGEQIIFDPSLLIDAIVKDHSSGGTVSRIAGRFHYSLASMIEEVCSQIRVASGLNRVVLSGGVFQNCLLTGMLVERLEHSGFQLLTHSQVPPNDGGLALGQAAVAAR